MINVNKYFFSSYVFMFEHLVTVDYSQNLKNDVTCFLGQLKVTRKK